MVNKKTSEQSRNVQKSGNSYSLYLPMDWIKHTGIDDNPSVRINTDESGNLIVSPSKSAKLTETEKIIDIKNYDFELVRRIIGGCYMNGYSRFKLNFEKPLPPKELMKHKKNLDKLGLDVEILETTDNSVTFYVNESLASPLIIFKNLMHKALNLIRAKEQNETELVEGYLRDVRRGRYIIYRAFRTTVKNPSALAEFNISAMNCLNMHNVSQHLVDSTKVIIEQKLTSEDITNFKKILEILLVFSSEQNLEYLQKYNDILKKIKNKSLEEELKKIHRELTKWWIGY